VSGVINHGWEIPEEIGHSNGKISWQVNNCLTRGQRGKSTHQRRLYKIQATVVEAMMIFIFSPGDPQTSLGVVRVRLPVLDKVKVKVHIVPSEPSKIASVDGLILRVILTGLFGIVK
jgi:hypothetical protein